MLILKLRDRQTRQIHPQRQIDKQTDTHTDTNISPSQIGSV